MHPTNPYAHPRAPAVATRWMVAASQPLAARAGLAMLEAGGNAADAALAAATTLTVVMPTSNGIGGDAFALVWDGARLHGLNGSGRAPAALDAETLVAAGHRTVPERGWASVTVPGAPRAWVDFHARFGRLDLEAVFAPAIEIAERGHAVTPFVAGAWALAAESDLADFAGWKRAFTRDGRAPRAGELWRAPGMARSLQRIAASRAEAFYTGELAAALVAASERDGGYLSRDDLAAHQSQWVDPISARFGDHEIWEIPPNGQGLAALIALRLVAGLELSRYPRDSVEAYHYQIEAMKLAFADAHAAIGDPDHAPVPVGALLDEDYLAARRDLITGRAGTPGAGPPARGGTVYLCAVDGDGMMVSWIQSNFHGFGSGIVLDEHGISLHNRGAGFTLEPGHPNRLAPGKRPFHTIIPGFLTRDGEPVGPFGLMGAHMQPQGHLQLILNCLVWGLDPQAALDAPRWRFERGRDLLLELGTPRHLIDGLAARGHQITIPTRGAPFGRGAAIWRRDDGTLIAGAESRAGGVALGR